MDRSRRYPSDLTDKQWEFIEPMLPLPKWMGRPEKHPRRVMVDAILYVVRTGCAWRYLPADLPPWETVYGRFRQWNKRGVTERILTELREQVRISHGRNPEPSAGIIDSQSVKAADTVAKTTRGYDAGKKVGGRKRFIVTDTLGLLIVVCVMAASVQDRDGAKGTLLDLYQTIGVRYVLADGGFAGVLVGWCARILKLTLDIVRKPKGQKGFALIPRRWPVDRTFGWLMLHRRLARDYETDPEVSEHMIRWAAINGMLGYLDRGGPAIRQARRTFNTPA
jgi:transposase